MKRLDPDVPEPVWLCTFPLGCDNAEAYGVTEEGEPGADQDGWDGEAFCFDHLPAHLKDEVSGQ